MKARYALIFTLSYLSLLAERLWNRFWPTTTVALFFMALALLNMPSLLGPTGHLAFVILFFLALAVTLGYTRRPFSFPSRAEIERRMEDVSTLEHRPLEALNDKPVNGLTKDALMLWQKHLKKAASYIGHLKIYPPRPDVSRQDKYALRQVALIFFAAGLMVAQGDATPRLRQAVSPDLSAFSSQKTAALDLWIVPPEYTRQTAIFLSTAKQGLVSRDNNVAVPKGSILKVRLSGFRFSPRLNYAGQSRPLTETAQKNYSLELPLNESGELALTYLLAPLGRWNITAAPDTPPDVSITQVDTTPRAAVKISYKAQDDHGIAKMAGVLTLRPELAEKLGKESHRFNIQPPSGKGAAAHVEDLTASLWAGLPVFLALEAEDTTGQKSDSAPVSFVLPERTFTNPIAQKLIDERKSLLWTTNPLNRRAVAEHLMQITDDPSLYKGDIVTFLALSVAAKRLIRDGGEDAVKSVQGILWEVALTLEDGGLSLAQRELRDALQKMQSSLADKSVSKDQLQDLVDDVKKKMQAYVQSLANEMRQRLQEGKNVPVLSPEIAKKFMKNIDLNKMLEQMKQLSQAHSREDLQQMAENLKNSIDNLDMKKFDQMQEKQMKAMQGLQDLDNAIKRQQSLYDQTNKGQDPSDVQEQKQEQSGIRQQLGEALRKMGEALPEIPENFTTADQKMKQSEQALGQGQPRTSLPHQKAALDEMQKGLDQTIEKMAQSMQQSLMSFGMMPGGGEGYDPLGRQNTGRNGDTKIPDEKEQRRVQEIIEELRHRSNEPNRTKAERDYLDRLLEEF